MVMANMNPTPYELECKAIQAKVEERAERCKTMQPDGACLPKHYDPKSYTHQGGATPEQKVALAKMLDAMAARPTRRMVRGIGWQVRKGYGWAKE